MKFKIGIENAMRLHPDLPLGQCIRPTRHIIGIKKENFPIEWRKTFLQQTGQIDGSHPGITVQPENRREPLLPQADQQIGVVTDFDVAQRLKGFL